jgi:replicative DNA helicase
MNPLSIVPEAEMFNQEAECSVLVMMLIQQENIPWLASKLEPEDFYFSVHQRMFSEFCDIYRQRGSIVPPMILKKYKNDPEVIQEAGEDYVKRLLEGVPPGKYFAEQYVQSLRALRIQREAYALCQEMAGRFSAGDPFEAQDCIEDLVAGMHRVQGLSSDASIISGDAVSQQIVAECHAAGLPIGTGLPRLDRAMDGGVYPRKAYAFAARMKVGKTIMASTLSYNFCKQGVKHLFLAGEMGATEIHERLLARELDWSPSRIKASSLRQSEADRQAVEAVRSKFDSVLYKNAQGITLEKLQSVVELCVLNHGIKGFILDYWQLVKGRDKSESEASFLEKVAQWIADACRRYNIWAIVMCQLNQDDNTRGSEGIKLAFDQVYKICREGDLSSEYWLEMMGTRYTQWNDVGEKAAPAFIRKAEGPYFQQS